jgi:hypothetical protein
VKGGSSAYADRCSSDEISFFGVKFDILKPRWLLTEAVMKCRGGVVEQVNAQLLTGAGNSAAAPGG